MIINRHDGGVARPRKPVRDWLLDHPVSLRGEQYDFSSPDAACGQLKVAVEAEGQNLLFMITHLQRLWHYGVYKEDEDQDASWTQFSIWLRQRGISMDPSEVSKYITTFDYLMPWDHKRGAEFILRNPKSLTMEVARYVGRILGKKHNYPRNMPEEELALRRPVMVELMNRIEADDVAVRDVKMRLTEWGYLSGGSSTPVRRNIEQRGMDEKILDYLRKSNTGMVGDMFIGRRAPSPAVPDDFMRAIYDALWSTGRFHTYDQIFMQATVAFGTQILGKRKMAEIEASVNQPDNLAA